MTTQNYEILFAKKRTEINNAEIAKEIEHELQTTQLMQLANKYIDEIIEMYNIYKSAERNNFRFNTYYNNMCSWKSHITIIPFKNEECRDKIKYPATDGWYHRLGFYLDKNCNVMPKFGYQGGGCNKGDVFVDLITKTWFFNGHNEVYYLNTFIKEIEDYKSVFHKSINEFCKN